MNRRIALFLALCLVSMVFVVVVPSAQGDQIATNIKTHHREGSSPDYTYPSDNYFRDENDIYSVPDGYDDVYYSFYATDGQDPYEGFILVEILDPSDFAVYTNGITLVAGDEGVYSSWEDGEYWEVPNDPDLGIYTLNVWNATEIIGIHTFEIYEPSTWRATVELFEDFDRTIIADRFPIESTVYYSVHIEDENGGPLYYSYNYDYAYSYATHNSDEEYLDSLYMDYYGDELDSFYLDDYDFVLGDWDVQIRYPSGTDIPDTTTFTVYEPIYTADIKTYVDGYVTETSTYPIDGRVYWTAHIEDQYGKNFPQGDPVYLQIEHDGSTWTPYYWGVDVESEGNVSDNFWLTDSIWDDEQQIGLYTMRLSDSRYGDPFPGSTDFEVIGIKISPEKSRYAQTEEITITITTEIYQDDIDVTIYNDEWQVIKSWKEQSMDNKIWTNTYILPDSLPDGSYSLYVNESETERPLGMISFNIQKYLLKIWPDAGAYLPGEKMTVFYTVISNKDGQGVPGTKIQWRFRYYDTEDDEYKVIPQELTDSAHGTFDISIPETASKNYNGMLYVWANDTSDHSAYADKQVNIGGISASVNVGYDEYMAGDFVVVTVTAWVESSYPLRDGNVGLIVSREGIEIPSYMVTNLKTDTQGHVTYIFLLASTAETGLYSIEANVTKENEWDTDDDTFEVVDQREMSLELSFDNKYYSDSDNPQYYSGDTVKVTYTALRGEDIIENVNCEYRVYDADNTNNYIAVGTTSSGEFSFSIPNDFEGRLRLLVEVTDSESHKASRWATIDVDGPHLLLTPKNVEYLPGDTVKVEYSIIGYDGTSVIAYYEVKDSDGNVIKRESLTTTKGEFQFTVPEANVPDYYSIRGYITDSGGVILDQSSVTVTRLRGYILTFTLDKNTYKPGETATLHYKIQSIDGSEIPRDFTLRYGFKGGPERTTQTSKSEGDLKVEIPDEAADGKGDFYVNSYDLPYGQYGSASAEQEANIRANPNPLAETVGDMSLLELILLVLVIIALLIAFIAMRRGKKALDESKLPPWKKERPLPEPEKFKDTEEPSLEEGVPGPMEEGIGPGGEEEVLPPPMDEQPTSPEELGSEPPKDIPP